MAEDAASRRRAALEEKKRRIAELKEQRRLRSGGAPAKAAEPAGDLNQYIDKILAEDVPSKPAETGTEAEETAAENKKTEKQQEKSEPKETAETAPAPAPTAAAVLAPAVETFEISTQVIPDDFPEEKAEEDEDSDSEDSDEEDQEADEESPSTPTSAFSPPRPSSPEEKEIAGRSPVEVSSILSSPAFLESLARTTKAVERQWGYGSNVGRFDIPSSGGAYADDYRPEEEPAWSAKDEEKKNLRSPRKRVVGKEGGSMVEYDGGDGLVEAAEVFGAGNSWTEGRNITSMDWSPAYKELFLASYAPDSSPSSTTPPSPNPTSSSVIPPASVDYPRGPDYDGTVLLWSLALPSRPEHVLCTSSPVLSCAFHPDEPHLVIGGTEDGRLDVWDLRARRLPVLRSATDGTVRGHPIVSVMAGAPETALGSTLVSAGGDGTIDFWSLAELSKPVETVASDVVVNELTGGLSALACMGGSVAYGTEGGSLGVVLPRPQGSTASKARQVRVWGEGSGSEESGTEGQGHYGVVTSLSANKGGKIPGNAGTATLRTGFPRGARGLMLSCGTDWTTRLWAPASMDTPVLTIVDQDYDYMCDVQWSPTHPSLFASSNCTGKISLWNLSTSLDEPLSGSDGITLLGRTRPANVLRWSGDGRRLGVSSGGQAFVLGISEEVTRSRSEEEGRMLHRLASRGFTNQ